MTAICAAAISASAILPASALADRAPARIDAPAGAVQGVQQDGVAQFRGIPYAAAPVGERRWRPPEPKPRWTTVRDATAFGPACAHVNTMATFAGPATDNEDCLSLNIFTPDDAKPASKLPVIVWLHGGGNFTGSSEPYDGNGLVKAGRVIVVTVNYRLGVFGFFAHPKLDSEGHPFANYGLMDQQLALRWVKDNIGAFGGDPQNVTIGGQSAGSADAQAHLVSPTARSLFHRVILMSGAPDASPLETSQARGVRIAFAAGCADEAGTADCLRRQPADVLMAAEAAQPLAPTDAGLIRDGQILPSAGLQAAFEAGIFAHVPVLSSTTRDEWNFVSAVQHYVTHRSDPLGDPDYWAFVQARASNDTAVAARIAAAYPLANYPSAQHAISAIGTEGGDVFQCATRRRLGAISKFTAAYAYQFDDRTAPSNLPAMRGHAPLADHTADIQYLFPGFRGGPDGVSTPLNPEQTRLSHTLMAAWTTFAWTGNPNQAGKAVWPKYNRSSGPAVVMAGLAGLRTVSDDVFGAANKCAFWEALSN